MNNIYKKIIAKILSDYKITVRDLLETDIQIDITDDYNGKWLSHFQGPVELTVNGIAKWSVNDILSKEVIIKGDKATVIGINNDEECEQLCSLFNTINKNVNKNTFKKYIKK